MKEIFRLRSSLVDSPFQLPKVQDASRLLQRRVSVASRAESETNSNSRATDSSCIVPPKRLPRVARSHLRHPRSSGLCLRLDPLCKTREREKTRELAPA